MNLPIFLFTCPKYQHVASVWLWLFEKFWIPHDPERKIVLFTYGSKENNTHVYPPYVSVRFMAEKDPGAAKWSNHVMNVLRDPSTPPHFIFTLEDCFIVSDVNAKVVKICEKFASENSHIGRIDLRLVYDKKHCTGELRTIADGVKCDILRNDSMLRLTLQPNIFSTTYFLKYLRENQSPWEVETESYKKAQNDGYENLMIRTFEMHGINRGGVPWTTKEAFNLIAQKVSDAKWQEFESWATQKYQMPV